MASRGKGKKNNDNMYKRILAYGLVFLVAVTLLMVMQRKENRRASDVTITINALPSGDFLLKQEDVMKDIDLAFGHQIKGVPLKGIDMERLERVMEKNPFVLKAETYINAEHEVNIEIWQREPIVRVVDKNGLNYYLDGSGAKMNTSEHYTARVLVATGNIPPFDPKYLKTKKKNNLRNVYELTKVVLNDELLTTLVGQIHVENNGDLTLVPIVGRQQIIVGSLEDVDDKIDRLKIFYDEVFSRLGWNKYKTINLKYKDQVVCEKV